MQAARMTLIILLSFAFSVHGRQDPGPESAASQADVEAVIMEYQEAFSTWVTAVSGEADPVRQAALIEERPSLDSYARRLMAIAASAPGSPAAFTALQWSYIEAKDDELRSAALHEALGSFQDEEQIGVLCPMLERDAHVRARSALKQLADNSPHPAVRGNASVALGSWLLRFGSKSDEEQAIQLLEAVAATYGELPAIMGQTLGADANARLFELRHLAIGSVVPEISGEDLKGDAFKLSDYRGRVVLLPFWAHWCGGCMLQAAHERFLVTAYADRPFVIVGVNADPDPPARVIELNRRSDVNWRSFRNDSDGMRSLTGQRWNIHTLPTTYLIDHNGVIVKKWLATVARPEEMRTAVDEAVRRAEEARTRDAAGDTAGRL